MKKNSSSPDTGLRIVWWNTGLSPARVRSELDEARVSAAATVLEHLLEVVRADLIVLGEMGDDSLKALRTACPIAQARCTWLPTFLKAGQSRFSICVLSRSDRLVVRFNSCIVKELPPPVRRVGLHFQVDLRVELNAEGDVDRDDVVPGFDLIASHWPSRLHLDRADSERTHIAAHLRRWMSDHLYGLAQRNVVLVGDFNEEPFDEGLERYLLASRDSGKVRRCKDLLYNPFWRHLSSFRPSGDTRSLGDPGTHFHPSVRHSDWHTFDQLMVSSPLVSGCSGWRLNEENTRVVQFPKLADDDGKSTSCFDHQPIVGHLERFFA